MAADANITFPFAENSVKERELFEHQKYGRIPMPGMAAHKHVYQKHSIEPEYGLYDRPINEIV